jgi:regulatory protein
VARGGRVTAFCFFDVGLSFLLSFLVKKGGKKNRTMSRKITAFKVQKRNPNRVNVFLDGEFAFGLARIAAAWLQVGQVLEDEKIIELQAQDESEKAYQQALKFLSYRPRTETEVRRNLEQHDIAEEVIIEVIDRLRRSGLVDDARFAQAWSENRSEFRPRSRKALAFELRQHGLDGEAIEQALSDLDDGELAYRAAIKQSRKLNNLEWPDFRRKLSDFLARRGFHYEVIVPVVKRVWDGLKANTLEEEVSL